MTTQQELAAARIERKRARARRYYNRHKERINAARRERYAQDIEHVRSVEKEQRNCNCKE